MNPCPTRTLCVFCGAKTRHAPVYRETVTKLAQVIRAKGLGGAYGSGRVGRMGGLADQVLAGDGRSMGLIPRSLATAEVLLHRPPCGVLNGGGHSRPLLDFRDPAVAPGCLAAADRERVLVDTRPDRRLAALLASGERP